MPTPDIRDSIIDELKTIAGLGGAEQRITKHWYETDDIVEAREFWETTDGPTPLAGPKQINATMLRRNGREDREVEAGKEFATVHEFLLRFRYGKKNDTLAEQTFESFLDLILDKLKNNNTIYRRPQLDDPAQPGLHPGEQASQSALATVTNKKLFNMRVWEADIVFSVVEWEFC